MTAEEIIKKHLSKIEGIRIPYVNKLTSSILGEMKDLWEKSEQALQKIKALRGE
jgi:hypothetical protein